MDASNYIDDFKKALKYRVDFGGQEIEYFRRELGDEGIVVQYFNEVLQIKGKGQLTVDANEILDSPRELPDWYVDARKEIVKDIWFQNWGAIKERNRQALRELKPEDFVFFRQCAGELLINHPDHEAYLGALFEVYDPSTYADGKITMKEKGSGFSSGEIEAEILHSRSGYNRSELEDALRSEAYDGKPLTKKPFAKKSVT
ncbi:MAG: hypothetical protein H0T78_11905 [Longispora sp.]|nr:hypothetical protein [Longispora sp. (in: high G+C Gram-positive bacteria)]